MNRLLAGYDGAVRFPVMGHLETTNGVPLCTESASSVEQDGDGTIFLISRGLALYPPLGLNPEVAFVGRTDDGSAVRATQLLSHHLTPSGEHYYLYSNCRIGESAPAKVTIKKL